MLCSLSPDPPTWPPCIPPLFSQSPPAMGSATCTVSWASRLGLRALPSCILPRPLQQVAVGRTGGGGGLSPRLDGEVWMGPLGACRPKLVLQANDVEGAEAKSHGRRGAGHRAVSAARTEVRGASWCEKGTQVSKQQLRAPVLWPEHAGQPEALPSGPPDREPATRSGCPAVTQRAVTPGLRPRADCGPVSPKSCAPAPSGTVRTLTMASVTPRSAGQLLHPEVLRCAQSAPPRGTQA